MDNYSIVVNDWIRALRTMDPVRSQVNIENIQENFFLFTINDQRALILTFIQHIQQEKTEGFIKNYISCLGILNQSQIVSSLDLLKETSNPVVSKYLLNSILNHSPSTYDATNALISHCISQPFSTLCAHTISLITQNLLTQFVPSLKSLFLSQASVLYEHFHGNHSLSASEYDILLENIYSLLISLEQFKEDSIKTQYMSILSYLCENTIYSLNDPKKKKLSKVICQLVYAICSLGEHADFLYQQFQKESSEQVKIAIIHVLSEFHHPPAFKNAIMILTKIAKDDHYFAFAVASMVKIGGDEVKNYILSELSSGTYRRVFFTTYFLPYLHFQDEIYLAILDNLLTYKQPLILKQALWVIRKKNLTKYIPHAIKLLFHENEQVKKEAQKVLLEAPYPKTIEQLTKTVNYYSPDKQEVIYDLIVKLRKLNL